MKVWETYLEYSKKGYEITNEFNQLVTNCLNNLLADNIRIPGFSRKADITLVKKKEAIKYIYITMTFKYTHKVTQGFKLSGLFGDLIARYISNYIL